MGMRGTVRCRATLAYSWSSVVLKLHQHLRRWPKLNQHLECAVFAGKALTVNMLEVNSVFRSPW